MRYQTAKIRDGKIVITHSKEIEQNKLTSDCFLVQFVGIEACANCELRGTADCGGGETLKSLQ